MLQTKKHNNVSDIKKEYTNELINLLYIPIYDGIRSIYETSKSYYNNHKDTLVAKQFGVLVVFQIFIRKIPKWDQEIITKETQRIQSYTKCDYLDELIKALIKCNLQLLSNNNTENITYDNITLSNFIHKSYLECSRIFFTRPYLFQDYSILPIDKQKNLKDCEDIIKLSIENAVRKSLPFKSIINNYINSSFSIVEVDRPHNKKLGSSNSLIQVKDKGILNKSGEKNSEGSSEGSSEKNSEESSDRSRENKFICKNNKNTADRDRSSYKKYNEEKNINNSNSSCINNLNNK